MHSDVAFNYKDSSHSCQSINQSINQSIQVYTVHTDIICDLLLHIEFWMILEIPTINYVLQYYDG